MKKRRRGPLVITVAKLQRLIPVIRAEGLARLRFANRLLKVVRTAKERGARTVRIDARKA